VRRVRLAYCAEHAAPQLRQEIWQTLVEESRAPLLVLDQTEGVRRPDLWRGGARVLRQSVQLLLLGLAQETWQADDRHGLCLGRWNKPRIMQPLEERAVRRGVRQEQRRLSRAHAQQQMEAAAND